MPQRYSLPSAPAAMAPFLPLLATLLCLVCGVSVARAQTDVQLTQYWAVPTLYNPATTGDEDFVRIRGGAKMQWVGIKNAPQSFLAAGDMPFMLGKHRIGIGVNLTQESLGLFSNMALNVQASYKFKLLKGTMSVGLQGGFFTQTFKGSEIVTPDDDDYHQSTDEALPTQDLTGNTFDLAFGVHYTHKYFYASLSCLHLLQPSINMSIEGSESTESQEFYTEIPRMLYFMAGSNIPIKNTLFEVQPSLLVKSDFNSFAGEVTLRGRYNKFVSLGLGYRWNEGIVAMVGVDYKNFFLGYAYDYPLSALAKASSGSHEIVAGYRLKLDLKGKNKNRHKSIRIM